MKTTKTAPTTTTTTTTTTTVIIIIIIIIIITINQTNVKVSYKSRCRVWSAYNIPS